MNNFIATFGMAFVLGLLTLLTVVIVVSIWQFATTQRCQAASAAPRGSLSQTGRRSR